MIKAIVYKTNTGHTLRYANMLGKKLDILVCDLKKAKKELNKNDEIIYLGWICAGRITGFNKAKKRYNVKCCIPVGAYPKDEKYVEQLKKGNNVNIPLFYLRGGIDYTKLKGVQKKIVQMVGKVLEKEVGSDNKELVEIFKNGKDFVSEENLNEVIEYIKENKLLTSK